MATCGKRFPPNNTKTMAKIMVSSQAPIPNINTPYKNLASNKVITIRYCLQWAGHLLWQIGIESFFLDAQLLLAHALKRDRLDILINNSLVITKNEFETFLSLLKRRLLFEPISYILGKKEFFSLEFIVNKHCLIPRADSEILVEAVLDIFNKDSNDRILDIGVGSGALIISVLYERPQMTGLAIDISPKALAIAKENARKNNIINRISFLESDLYKNISKYEKFKIIISNPPYIGVKEYFELMPDVLRYEPKIALKTKDDAGLQFYNLLLKESGDFLLPGGFLIMEIGYKHRYQLEDLIDKKIWKNIKFLKDLGKNDRVIILEKA